MASVLSLQQGWGKDEQPKFQVNGQFKPLRDSVNAGDSMSAATSFRISADTAASVFLWEWFTTKPYVDSGDVRFIGSVYSESAFLFPFGPQLTSAPWPCWSIAAAPAADKASVSAFLAALQPHVVDFDSEASRAGPAVDFVEKTFGQQRADVEDWLKTVKYEHQLAEVSELVVRKTLGVLQEAGVVPKEGQEWDMATFIDTDVAKVVA